MENNSVPYIAHESAMARLERIIKRLWIVIIILIVLLAGTSAAWIWYETQWEDVTETVVTQAAYSDGEGTALVNNGGDLNYGK